MRARPAQRSSSTSRNHRREAELNDCLDLGSPALHVGSSASAWLSLVPHFPQCDDSHRSLRWCLPDFGFLSMAGDCQSRAISGTLALERNIVAAAILGFLAAVPIFRFLRLPGHLLASSLIGWLI